MWSFSLIKRMFLLFLLSHLSLKAGAKHHDRPQPAQRLANQTKDAFINHLVTQMTVPELVMQVYMLFADSAIGKYSNNSRYDQALAPAPSDAGIGVIHDWYTLNTTNINELQALNLEKSRLKVPFMHTGECLHGVGSFKQSMFPQTIGLAASWDPELVHRVGSAIGTEARSIGIHACFSPVLDLCQDPRWGRCQEDWGEDKILTSHLGVAYASGLSKNSSWNQEDAVVPVMKHFAAHGSPQGGHNTAPFMGHGNRQVLEQLLVPFQAAFDLGGARGVMMAYNELDDVPAPVSPMLYDALAEWGYDGFVIADDLGMSQLQTIHQVAATPADAIGQWFNAGGMVDFYDYSLETYLESTIKLVENKTVALETLQDHVRRILGVKYNLGLFQDPYLSAAINPHALVDEHVPLTLEAAQKSIVLLENKNDILPLSCDDGKIRNLAIIGPFGDILNYGDYSGQFGAYPVAHSSTLRQGILQVLEDSDSSIEVSSATGANTWLYNAQYPIPGYHLSTRNGTIGSLSAVYYADTNFSEPMVHIDEVPVRDWGLYPPPGLPSNNFSAIWEGELHVPVDIDTDGWLGVAISPNTTAKLYVDGNLFVEVPFSDSGNVLSNIPSREYSLQNSTAAPPGSDQFTFKPGGKHKIRLEFQAWNLYHKIENQSSLNAEVLLFWNLVDRSSPVEKAVRVAQEADIIVLAVGARWDSDGENGDRGTLDLSANQTQLANAIYGLNKPVILILEGGRPFAIPEYYEASAAALSGFFGGQSAGQAMAAVLFGKQTPGGRMPLTVPAHVGQLPVYYNYKPTAHLVDYLDIDSMPAYPFGYGLSYTNFSLASFKAAASMANGSEKNSNATFSAGDTLIFSVTVQNNGAYAGSYVPQVYLLERVSQIVQPVKQLMAFTRVYLEPGESESVHMGLEVDRYLRVLNRRYQWEVEKGTYTFALLENGGMSADSNVNVTLQCT